MKSVGQQRRSFSYLSAIENNVGHVQKNRSFNPSDSTTRDMKKDNNDNIQKTILNLSQRMSDDYSLTPKICSILLKWNEEWKQQQRQDKQHHRPNKNAATAAASWKGIFTKSNLLHEVEESIIALQLLKNWLDNDYGNINTDDKYNSKRQHKHQPRKVTIVDVCCGKGLLATLASYLFANDCRISSQIIMFDKDTKVNWSHIHAANKNAVAENRPIIEYRRCNLFEMDNILEWLSSSSSSSSSRSSLSDDDDDAEQETKQEEEEILAMVGIHLCKNLSPTFVGIANSLGASKVPFICLAPCCLPRIVLQGRNNNDNDNSDYNESSKVLHLDVATYESPLARQTRLIAAKNRQNAKQRKTPCLLCQSTNHKIQSCPDLSKYTQQEQLDLIQKAAESEPCWRCGELGHTKANCPSTQTSNIPSRISRPITSLDVSHIMSTTTTTARSGDDPFETYCKALSTTIELNKTHIYKSKLDRTDSHHQDKHMNNWNRNRKSIYIVASKH